MNTTNAPVRAAQYERTVPAQAPNVYPDKTMRWNRVVNELGICAQCYSFRMMGRELLTKRSYEDEEKENAITKNFVGLEPAGPVVQSCGRRQVNVSG
jgi:hypothetical protein